jgi:hypothetical protein
MARFSEYRKYYDGTVVVMNKHTIRPTHLYRNW